MKKLLLFISLVTLLIACKDDACEKNIDNILQAKSTYESSASEANCFAYKTALEGYLTSSCKSEEPQVDYKSIFQSYYDALPCEVIDTTPPPPPPTDNPTCTDGVQNGTETGVDCGGLSCIPCATIYIRYNIGADAYEHTPTNYNMLKGNSSTPNHRVTSGNIINATTTEGRLSFYFFESTTTSIAEFQGLINNPIPFETPGVDFARFKYSDTNGNSLNSDGAGNDASNSSLTVTSVTQLDGEPISFNVTGTFTCKTLNEIGGSVDITNGEFSMVYLGDD